MPNINKIRLSGTTYTVQDENAITQIKTINNQSLIGEGNIDIQGGGSVTVDPSLNSGSTNPVANSAITEAVTASEKNVWIKSNTLYSFFQSITGITYNFAVGSAVVGQRINITFQDGGNEVWEYGYSSWSWSCSSTSLESPHYTVSQDGKLWVFTQNDDGVTVNSASIESTNTVTQKNLTFILLETTNVIPSETLGQRVGRIERVLKSLDGMAFPFYNRNYSSSSAIGNTAVAQINTQTGEISYSDSGYNLFGLDAKTFGWEQDINSNPNGKLTFTKYLIDKDVLLSTSPNFSIDVSSIEGEGYTNDKSLTSMKVWAIKTNPNYSQSFADLHVSIIDTVNTISIAEISFMYDENRGLTIEDMMSRTSMSYPNFKFGDTVVADFNGVFQSGNCNIRINNWDGSNCFVSSIDFYELSTDTSYHSDYVILFDEWMYGIEERFSELDDKEEATAKALYDLKDTKLDGYATTGDVQTATADMATKTWVGNQGYLTEHQSLSNYYTKSETSGATEISTALATKQATLVSGTNIKTINNESILGSGNITIEGGGGSSYTAGDGIDITNDVISVTGKVDTTTYTTYTAATDTALASKQTTLTAGTGISIVDNVISSTGGGGSITIDPSLDSGSTNPVANSAITNAIANATNGTLKEDLVFSATCGYGTIESNVGSPSSSALRINIYPAKTLQFIQYRSRSKKYYYKCFVLDIETKTEYNAYWNVTYNDIKSSGGTGINYVTLNLPDGRLKFTVTDDTKYRIIGFERDKHSSSSSRESYSTDSTYEVNIPSGTTTNELFQYIENVDRTKNAMGLTFNSEYGLSIQTFTDKIGGKMYYLQSIFPLNTSFTAHTANTTIHVTSAQTTSWDAKVDSSAITTSVTSGSTDSQVPSAKAVYDQLGGLKLVKLTQSDYDALVSGGTVDASTLYIITNVVN